MGISARWPVSRVLSPGRPEGLPSGWPFIWDAGCPAPLATNPGGGAETRLAPYSPSQSRKGWNRGPCRPYSVLLPVGFTVPPLLPGARCALTAPFHPYRGPRTAGGLLSVALSLGSPPPAVSRHRVSVEPGLSSPDGCVEGGHPAIWRGTVYRGTGQTAMPVGADPKPAPENSSFPRLRLYDARCVASISWVPTGDTGMGWNCSFASGAARRVIR